MIFAEKLKNLFLELEMEETLQNIVKQLSIARQRVVKRILAATNTEATIEELPFLCNSNVNILL
jgi:hypothetical protein